MSSFIDKVRNTYQPKQVPVVVIGVDPDVDTAGIAEVRALVSEQPGMCGTKITSARLVSIKVRTKRAGHDRAVDAAAQIQAAIDAEFGVLPLQYHTVIETSEIYANRDDPWHVVVSKANACIQLALVAGGVFSLVDPESTARLVLPREWKGQAKKSATAYAAAALLARNNAEVQAKRLDKGSVPWSDLLPSQVEELPKHFEHAADALGIALYGVNQLELGLWQ